MNKYRAYYKKTLRELRSAYAAAAAAHALLILLFALNAVTSLADGSPVLAAIYGAIAIIWGVFLFRDIKDYRRIKVEQHLAYLETTLS
ncbi:MAG: hypothetical protein LBP91_01750 [Coriobacteriales bacterium]|jgi:hypothetical protein|nr:hypothetical protein [Coriobacteriales bacterium]